LVEPRPEGQEGPDSGAIKRYSYLEDRGEKKGKVTLGEEQEIILGK